MASSATVSPSDICFRRHPLPDDGGRVREILTATGFFSQAEIEIGVELVDEALTAESDYHFSFVLLKGAVVGYACFGPIPLTRASWDLYWIAIHPCHQSGGVGARLLGDVEASAAAAGCAQMFVDTSGRAQYTPTRAFYERRGYRRAAELEDFYDDGDGKVVYSKRLGPVPATPPEVP